jgi:hypothetical protein
LFPMNHFRILASHSPFRLLEAAWEHVVFGGGAQQDPGWVLSVVIIQRRRCEKIKPHGLQQAVLSRSVFLFEEYRLLICDSGPVERSLLVFRRNSLHPSSGRRISRAWGKNGTVIGGTRTGTLGKPVGEEVGLYWVIHGSGSISLFTFNTRPPLLQ